VRGEGENWRKKKKMGRVPRKKNFDIPQKRLSSAQPNLLFRLKMESSDVSRETGMAGRGKKKTELEVTFTKTRHRVKATSLIAHRKERLGGLAGKALGHGREEKSGGSEG